jgi:transcriptional regulator with XRE-family HTH domain
MKRANRLVADAVKAAAWPVEELADRAGVSSSALRRYRLGDRTPSPEVLRRLAAELRSQAKRLERLAHNLETEARKGGKKHA